jgi:CubicO group peptidase (beta-lactamase class C family)
MTTPDSPTHARFDGARALLAAAVAERASPAAAIEVGRRGGAVWTEAFGRLTYDVGAPACTPETIFDLASLTKVISTASIAMQAVTNGRLDLEMRVREVCAPWRQADREGVTIRHLLEHSSGLPAHVPLWKQLPDAGRIEQALAELPLLSTPGSTSVYSDAGFILLGILLERVLGKALRDLFEPVSNAIGPTLHFAPPASLRARVAPTEFDPWRGRLLQSEVHDENAALLDGVAGHAGLFGTVKEVGGFARLVLSTFEDATLIGNPDSMRAFARRSAVPGSSRALAWDTMLPTSSCGTRFSARAIGHTGFTGTSLWIDPEMDVYVALLSNRVHPTRTNNRFQSLRPAVHDAVIQELVRT